jgi:hypothetical protein
LGEEFSKAILKALDGSKIADFLADKLRIIRLSAGINSPNETAPISNLKCFADPLKTARIVVKELENTPIHYRMILRVFQELSERVAQDDVEIKLSERLRLISGANITPSFKFEHSNKKIDEFIKSFYFAGGAQLEIKPTGLYLEFRTSGYLSSRRVSRAVGEFFDEVRAFYGACMAHGIMGDYSFLGEDISPVLIVNGIYGSGEELEYIERAEEDLVRCANLSTTGSIDEELKSGTSLDKLLRPVVKIFKAQNATKLKTACAWALRAHLSTRGLDKILESAITIEVLMGDRDTSDRVGLTKLIANRCAYALGKSSKEREEIIDFFVQFYRVRSEVVHSGRTALQADERQIVNEGLMLAIRILQHETALAA